MNKLPLLLLLISFFVLFSCSENEAEPFDFGQQGIETDVVTDASGGEYPFLDPTVLSYCGAGWGRKFCRFLSNYDGTIWTVAENENGDFPDIEFSNFTINEYFISFFNFDNSTSYCEGWKMGESTRDGIKWNIDIKKDQQDVFWFDYHYFGSGEEIESTTTYKFEVVDGILNFTTTNGESFNFNPSERDYSEDILDTDEIIRLEGCMFF